MFDTIFPFVFQFGSQIQQLVYFFGGQVTVTGLLTGQDLAEQLAGKALGETLYLSRTTLRAEGDLFLCGMSPEELSEKLSVVSAKAAATEESNKNIREWIEKADVSLKDSFASISKNITENNNKVFLESANDKVGGIVTPVSNELKELRAKVEELEERIRQLEEGGE